MKLLSNTKLEDSRVELEIQVTAEEFKAAVDKSVATNSKKIAVPGFRKGKAPRAMIEKMYGVEAFYEDAINECYPAAYIKAIEEVKIDPVDRADIEIGEVTAEGFTFKATVTVKPEVTLGDYKGISAEKELVVVEDEEVDVEINRVADRNARMITIEDRAAQNGDVALIDFEGFVDGVAFEGGKGEKYPLTLGSNQFIPGFEEQIVGKNIGEEFDVNVEFPAEYQAEELKGKPALFKVKLHELKGKEMPVIDDEFAKDISEFDTIAEFKADLKAKILERKEVRAEDAYESKLLEVVVAGMTVVVPSIMIEHRVDEMASEFDNRLQMQGLNLEAYLEYTNTDFAEFRKSFAVQAEHQVKTRLALEKIAEIESFVASTEDINAEYEKIAKNYGVPVERAVSAIPAESVAKDIVCNRAIDFIKENAASAADKPKKPAAKRTTKKKEETAEVEKAEKAPKATKAKKADKAE